MAGERGPGQGAGQRLVPREGGGEQLWQPVEQPFRNLARVQPFRALLKNKDSGAPAQTYLNRIHVLKKLPMRFWDTLLKMVGECEEAGIPARGCSTDLSWEDRKREVV